MEEKVTINKLFYNLQKQMRAKIETPANNHPVTKGNISENNWIEWLKEYLPKRYSVDKAFIIDSENNLSDQIDVVIYDNQYSPFIFKNAGEIYIPAESVYCILEVKQELNKKNLEYAGAKAESVRKLKRTSAQIVHAGGEYKKTDVKEPHKIIAGILTLNYSWIDNFDNVFKKNINSLINKKTLQIGCSLNKGSFFIDKEGDIVHSSEKESMIFFFMNLFKLLREVGTVTAIDIDKYTDNFYYKKINANK